METVHLGLSLDLARAAELESANVDQETARLLALELFREDKVSLGRAAELCQTPLAAFIEFVARHGVPSLRYGGADLEEERRSIDRLGV
jgi:predicted HTH domain antitoxin